MTSRPLGDFEPLGRCVQGIWVLLEQKAYRALRLTSRSMHRLSLQPGNAGTALWRGEEPPASWKHGHSPLHKLEWTVVEFKGSSRSHGFEHSIRHLAVCQTLRCLTLFVHGGRTVNLEALAPLTGLRKLAVGTGWGSVLSGVSGLSSLSSLESLSLHACNISDLRGMSPTLRYIELQGTGAEVTVSEGAVLVAYAEVTHLELLSFVVPVSVWTMVLHAMPRLRVLGLTASLPQDPGQEPALCAALCHKELKHLRVHLTRLDDECKQHVPEGYLQEEYDDDDGIPDKESEIHDAATVVVHDQPRRYCAPLLPPLSSSSASASASPPPCTWALESFVLSAKQSVMRTWVPWLLGGQTKRTLRAMDVHGADLDVANELKGLERLHVFAPKALPLHTDLTELVVSNGQDALICSLLQRLPLALPKLVVFELRDIDFKTPDTADRDPWIALSKLRELRCLVLYLDPAVETVLLNEVLGCTGPGDRCTCLPGAEAHAPSLRLIKVSDRTRIHGAWIAAAQRRHVVVSQTTASAPLWIRAYE